MKTTIKIVLETTKDSWNATIAEERDGAPVATETTYDLYTMPFDVGQAVEAYLDTNVLTPMARKLPLRSYTYLPTERKIGRIERFCSGYYDMSEMLTDAATDDDIKQFVADLNRMANVTPTQAKAMEIGSMFGWGCPGADPDNYNAEVLRTVHGEELCDRCGHALNRNEHGDMPTYCPSCQAKINYTDLDYKEFDNTTGSVTK